MIDPASILTAEARRALSVLPIKTRSETTVSNRTPPDLVSDTSSGDDSDDEDDDSKLTMSPNEIRVIRRLSARVNVLPVVSRADSLTDEKLLALKNASESQSYFTSKNTELNLVMISTQRTCRSWHRFRCIRTCI